MIVINLYPNAVKAQGHANANIKGQDIYCAGVSAITMGSINWFDPQTIEYSISDGWLQLKIIKMDTVNANLLNLLKIQLESLDTPEYQNYIKIVNHKQGI